MKKLFFVFFLFLYVSKTFAGDTIIGKWKGSIIGHVDDKNYFVRANIKLVKDSFYTVDLKVFSKDYAGNFTLNATFRNRRLYIKSVEKINEFPKGLLHIDDCFTGYFQYLKEENKSPELDLYRNPVYRYTYEFRTKDSLGNLIPDFECFTSLLLVPEYLITEFDKVERYTDSLISYKKLTFKDMAKRKIVSGKEWTVTRDKIILQVWDNNKEDGDIISLKFNDTWILSNFLLKKEKYTIELNLKQKDNHILMFAENLGSITPNTAAISIDDNKLIRTFILNSDMSKSETIKILYVNDKK